MKNCISYNKILTISLLLIGLALIFSFNTQTAAAVITPAYTLMVHLEMTPGTVPALLTQPATSHIGVGLYTMTRVL